MENIPKKLRKLIKQKEPVEEKVIQKKLKKSESKTTSKKKAVKRKDEEAAKNVKDVAVPIESALSKTECPKKRMRRDKKKKRGQLSDIAEPKVETVFFDEAPLQSFSDFELDERILKGVGLLGWERPTEVQMSMIDLALEGRNVMARARTGSGKTAAFVLPLLHRVLQVASSTEYTSQGPLALFIAPSKELASQAHHLLESLLRPLPFLSLLNLAELSETEKSVWENDLPELVVATPGKMATMLRQRPSFLSHVRHVVLDEADLLLSFGYEDEMKFVRRSLPQHYQCILTSATLTDDMTVLKKMFMPGPAVTIKLKEGDLPNAAQLTQYQLSVENDEQRFSILLALIKLRLIVGKSIIFVNSVDRCYQMNIFLGAFSIKSCILNATMPANSRCHVIDQFNKGFFPIVVASDASDVHGEGLPAEDSEKTHKEKRRGMDKESGVARGIDFHQVSNVINFDFPTSLESYIHRVGRTARGFNKGTALSFCVPSESECLKTVKEEMATQLGEEVLSPYEMRIKELDSFVLRAREALAACTKLVIKEARLAEIREEALRSAKLMAYFAKNPRERDLLQGDKKMHSLHLHSPAIADVPEYIVPKALRGMDYTSDMKKKKLGVRRRHKTANQYKYQKKQNDPLQSFSL